MSQNGNPADIKKSIHRASMLMVVSILLSRIIGFAREWILARTVGASAMTDVYLASFTIPDFLNYLMAAGALSISFIPILSQYVANEQEQLGKDVFRALLSWFGSVLLILIVLGEIFAYPLARSIAPGFSSEQTQMLVYLLRIILPAQLFFYAGGLGIAVQQTHGRFLLPAIAPLVYNGGIILFGVLLHRSMGVAGFSIGVLVGAFMSHGVLQWWGVRALGFSMRPSFDRRPDIVKAMKRYLWLTLPLACSFSLVVTDEWIGKYFASTMEPRALSWLSYARTEMRIPIAVIGQAAGVASFPYLSRLWSKGEVEQYGKTLLREIMKLWAAAPLAAVLLYAEALPITTLIYGGSKFTTYDLQNTAHALQMFSLGVFFWTVQVLLSRAFYACQITWLPSIMGGVVTVLIFPLYGYLGHRYSFQGLALAGSIGIAIYGALLWGMLRRHLRRHAPMLSMRHFYTFCSTWCLVLVGAGFVARTVSGMGWYDGSKQNALLEVVLVAGLVGFAAIGLLRTVFKNMTDGALY